MRLHVIGAAALALLLSQPIGAVAAPDRTTRPSVPSARELLAFDREVNALLPGSHVSDSAACGAQLQRLLGPSARPGFDRLPGDTRRRVLRAVIACGEAETREPEVLALVRRLEPLADDPSLVAAVNAVLIDADLADDKPVPAARRLITVIDNDPARVSAWWEPYLTPIITGAASDKPVYRELLDKLAGVTWTDETSARAARNTWALLRADERAAAGDLGGAEAALAGADEIDTLLLVAEDRAYAPLWAKFQAAGRFDWRRLAEAELVARRKIAEDNPESLRLAVWVQRRLRLLGRYDEAIDFGQGLRARMAEEGGFADIEAFGGPSLGELAFALLDVGRPSEAEGVFKDAMLVGENGDGGVSQRLDWAARLNGMGRHGEALVLLRDLGPADVSPYGAQWLGAERACALSKTNPSAAWSYLPQLLFNQSHGVEPLAKALLCLDRTEEAAALFIQRLRDPTLKWDALGAARAVRAPPAVGPFQAELLRRRDAMIARPDVQKAIAEAGRSPEVPLSGTMFGWF